MEDDRSKIEQAVNAICSREGYVITRNPSDHAGGKYSLRYNSAVTPTGMLQLDINFMYRVPLFAISALDSHPVGSYSSVGISTMDIHEIAAGKFAALLSCCAARDLYDAHRLFKSYLLDVVKLRLAFLVYGAINRKDWRTVSNDDIKFDLQDLENQLIPVLRSDALAHVADRKKWAQDLVEECCAGLDTLITFRDNEMEFLDLVLDHGEVRPELLTDDHNLQRRISTHPGLLWKALNVRNHKIK